jgi:hypothetical protein
MSISFFRFQNRFNFKPHRHDIGRPIFQDKKLEDNFFVLKIYQLKQADYEEFYRYQENYYLKKNPSQEEAFFKHIYDVVTHRIEYFKNLKPFTKEYRRGLEPTRKLEAFLAYLKTIDKWHKTEPIESVISEKNVLIDQLKNRIIELENQLKEVTKYDAGEKIVINKGSLPAFMNLVHDIQELTLPNHNKLVRSQAQSPWYKMIAKYFMHGDKDISIDTARNYFPAQKEDKPAKFIEISEKDKLFKIVPRNDK